MTVYQTSELNWHLRFRIKLKITLYVIIYQNNFIKNIYYKYIDLFFKINKYLISRIGTGRQIYAGAYGTPCLQRTKISDSLLKIYGINMYFL